MESAEYVSCYLNRCFCWAENVRVDPHNRSINCLKSPFIQMAFFSSFFWLSRVVLHIVFILKCLLCKINGRWKEPDQQKIACSLQIQARPYLHTCTNTWHQTRTTQRIICISLQWRHPVPSEHCCFFLCLSNILTVCQTDIKVKKLTCSCFSWDPKSCHRNRESCCSTRGNVPPGVPGGLQPFHAYRSEDRKKEREH